MSGIFLYIKYATNPIDGAFGEIFVGDHAVTKDNPVGAGNFHKTGRINLVLFLVPYQVFCVQLHLILPVFHHHVVPGDKQSFFLLSDSVVGSDGRNNCARGIIKSYGETFWKFRIRVVAVIF